MQPMQGSTWRGRAAGVVLGVLALCGVAAADTICVPDDYDTIQAAIDAAFDGDEICVAPGTYNEAIDFIGKAVRLYSTDGPEVTIIDATGLYERAVKCVTREGPDTVLEGLTITGDRLGGMWNNRSNPTVANCTFDGNSANEGAGMYNWESSPTVLGCTFTGNEAHGFGHEPGNGGGMYNGYSHPTVTNCTFAGNRATGDPGDGGGMFNFRSSPTVTNCTFIENTAPHGGQGGGMHNETSSPTVTNCTFTRNDVYSFGGGMSNRYDSSPTVTGCTLIMNTAGIHGGAMYNWASNNLTVTNCTFVANTAPNGRAIACDSDLQRYPNDVTLANCILWDGGDEIWNNDDSTILITYSDIQGGYSGVGNIDADPLCNEDGRPQAGSPCIDAGTNNAVPADVLDLDNDGDTIERVPVDLDGNHRFMDDGATEDTGCGPIVVDMGAYEFPGEPVHPVLIGDIDLDGIVGFDDLVQVLGAWGECDPECCLADVNFTWEVDFGDLLIVLDAWGPCPE